ncbi:hypothetical protein FisN_13Hh351 [Fistulifera solaris]|jgi:hypothetical protein|uniref:Uncharacterized protein n=1 Tax=Fistulifera solaris TaxID=1519565 RepID=A0A1Z5KMK9_FISSO|nr:hypothetical protein FisN_13Hh351 [Fistulifera solaris]|eukprot:GAX27563.1 hypothetical protein FisN_13Hh351 [Fistulifera solaris]
MFARSAAMDTLQGQAIQAVNAKWGDPHHIAGRESIGFPVCKKKYAPFRITAAGQIERLYGCVCHSHLRKAVIEKHGERKGWEPFGQWSLQKAKEIVRQESVEDAATCSSSNDDSSMSQETGKTVKCFNGSCVWKVKSAYDDVYWELNGHTVSDAEEE